jgi:hypothetical protein
MTAPPTACGHLTCLCYDEPEFLKDITYEGETVWVCCKTKNENCRLFLRESTQKCYCLDANGLQYPARKFIHETPTAKGFVGARYVCQLPGKDKCNFVHYEHALPRLRFNKTRQIKRLQ